MLKKAFSILQNYSLAEDAVSEACIRIFKNLHKIEDPSSNSGIAFIMMIVKNVSLTFLKQERTHPTNEFDETLESPCNLEQLVLSKISSENIYNLLNKLDEDSKNIFLYKYAYNMSHREISHIMKLSESNITVKLYRCKNKLKNLLIKEGYTSEL